MLSHNVFFTLEDSSAEACDRLIDACHSYLKPHDGVTFFAAGTLVTDLDREVNDRDFHVALHVVFETRAQHDAYQVSEKHVQFIEENRSNWAKVRVFDSDCR